MTGANATHLESFECSPRIDKWLWHCRFFKSRSAAARFVASGKVRVNRRPVTKTAHTLRLGDVLTFAWRETIIVVQVEALGVRRGPPDEAHTLYQDLSDPRHDNTNRPLAPASQPMLEHAYGQSDTRTVHAATG
jgi:ribosome-associated heat shock protein Hsp15